MEKERIAFLSLQAVTGLLMTYLGMIPPLVWSLLGLMVLDVIMGMLAARKEKNLHSDTLWTGLSKKIGTLIIIGAIHLVRDAAHLPYDLGAGAAGAYCVYEFVSLLENAGRLDIPLPPSIIDALAKVRDSKAKTGQFPAQPPPKS